MKEEEIKLLFDLAYTPIMLTNKRVNGGDFLSIAVPIMDALRSKGCDEIFLKKSARILVTEFNNLLSPQLDIEAINDLVETIYMPNDFTRHIAKSIADEFISKHKP